MFYTLSHYLVSLRIPLFLSFTHQHTHTLTPSCLLSHFSCREIYGEGNVGDRLLPCPVWTHQSDKVVEVVAATFAGLFLRRALLLHASPPPALAHVNPAAVAARSPTRPSFHQYCGAAPFSLCLPAIRLDVKCRELNVHSTNQSNFRSTGSVHCYKCTGIGLWYWDVLTFYLLT